MGWVVAGEIRDESAAYVNSHQVNSVTIESLNEMIKRFWEIEEVSSVSQRTVEEEECEEKFQKSHRRDPSGRYVVNLPFRENLPQLGDAWRFVVSTFWKDVSFVTQSSMPNTPDSLRSMNLWGTADPFASLTILLVC